MLSKSQIIASILLLQSAMGFSAEVKNGLRKRVDIDIKSADQKTVFEIDFEINEFNRQELVSDVVRSRMIGKFVTSEMNSDDDPEKQIADRSKELAFVSSQLSTYARPITFKEIDIKQPVKVAAVPTTAPDPGIQLKSDRYQGVKERLAEIESSLSQGNLDELEELAQIRSLVLKLKGKAVTDDAKELLRFYQTVESKYFQDGIFRAQGLTIPRFKAHKSTLGGRLLRGAVNRCLMQSTCNHDSAVAILVWIEVLQASVLTEVYQDFPAAFQILAGAEAFKTWQAKIMEMDETTRANILAQTANDASQEYGLSSLQKYELQKLINQSAKKIAP